MHTTASDAASIPAPTTGNRANPIALIVLCATLLPQAAAAAEPRPLWGYGVRGCADYLLACKAEEAGDAAEYQRYEDWLTGFISGLNLATGGDVLQGSGIESAMRRTRARCAGHRDEDFFNATMDFVRALTSLR